MADLLGFEIDMSELTAGLQRLSKTVDTGSAAAALAIGFELIRLSSREVPHDKGTLQNSATVQEINGDVVIGYHTPYAARLHEHPEYRFQKGRKGRYLIDPVINNQDSLGLKFAKALDEKVNG